MKNILDNLKLVEVGISLVGSILLVAGSWWALSSNVKANALAIEDNRAAIQSVASDVKESNTSMSEINSRLIVLETHLIYIRENMTKEVF
jgi:hypothetical protein